MGWFCKKRFLVLRPQDLLTWVHTMSHIPEQIQHPRHKTMWRRCEEDSTRQGGSHSGKSDSQFGRRAVFTGFSPHRLDGRTHWPQGGEKHRAQQLCGGRWGANSTWTLTPAPQNWSSNRRRYGALHNSLLTRASLKSTGQFRETHGMCWSKQPAQFLQTCKA